MQFIERRPYRFDNKCRSLGCGMRCRRDFPALDKGSFRCVVSPVNNRIDFLWDLGRCRSHLCCSMKVKDLVRFEDMYTHEQYAMLPVDTIGCAQGCSGRNRPSCHATVSLSLQNSITSAER